MHSVAFHPHFISGRKISILCRRARRGSYRLAAYRKRVEKRRKKNQVHFHVVKFDRYVHSRPSPCSVCTPSTFLIEAFIRLVARSFCILRILLLLLLLLNSLFGFVKQKCIYFCSHKHIITIIIIMRCALLLVRRHGLSLVWLIYCACAPMSRSICALLPLRLAVLAFALDLLSFTVHLLLPYLTVVVLAAERFRNLLVCCEVCECFV